MRLGDDEGRRIFLRFGDDEGRRIFLRFGDDEVGRRIFLRFGEDESRRLFLLVRQYPLLRDVLETQVQPSLDMHFARVRRLPRAGVRLQAEGERRFLRDDVGRRIFLRDDFGRRIFLRDEGVLLFKTRPAGTQVGLRMRLPRLENLPLELRPL